jgi:hypothetical protein
VTDPDWKPPPAASAAWSSLLPGAALTIVKLAPDGSEAARYQGEVVGHREDSWLIVHATWTHRTVEVGELAFRPGDELLEWFSPCHLFNAFAVFSPEDYFKGWYANVTHLPRLDVAGDSPVLVWHDLYLDLVGLPDGSFTLRDDDELLASGLADADSALHARILEAQSELIRRFERRLPPFADLSTVTLAQVRHQQNALAP